MNVHPYPCPCCGFLVFDRPAGSYDLCRICDWEDDQVQLEHPGMSGGANTESLAEAQRELLKSVPANLEEYDGVRRDPTWRPLVPEDLIPAGAPTDGLGYFEGAVADSPPYYWRVRNLPRA